jgi:putative membrane protein
MNILEIKIKQATGGEKRNVGRLLKSGCNEEENEESNVYPNFRKLVFSVFLSIVLP